MPLNPAAGDVPGENFDTSGKVGSYSPGKGDETPYKPVLLNHHQSENTIRSLQPKSIPKPDINDSRDERRWCSKPKVVAAAICLVIILLLIIILPLALTLGQSGETSHSKQKSDPISLTPVTHRTTTKIPTTIEIQTTNGATTDVETTELPTTTKDGEEILDREGPTEEPNRATLAAWRPPPPPVANCTQFGYTCLSGDESVGTHQRCNGIMDCTDGSDELACKKCETSFSCPGPTDGEFICVPGDKICGDGEPVCPGGEDKNLYCKSSCDSDSYKCKSHDRCIPKEWKCDGEQQCPDGDDERGCKRRDCKNKAFWCKGSRLCLPIWMKCDGSKQCKDGSDELGCDCRGCSGKNTVLCKDPGGMCIRKAQLCDGHNDCPGREDEIDCPGYCKPDKDIETVRCKKHERVPKRIACSGLKKECEHRCKECDPELAFTCKSGKTKCIPKFKVCDGERDCDDGSDEKQMGLCACEAPDDIECRSDGLSPPKCIRASQKCDGYADCPGQEDEINCDSCRATIPEFSPVYCASSRRCYPSTTRCDGEVQCPDYSDEDGCSCTDCKSQSYPTFMCRANNRCLKQDFICNPKSPFHCPGVMPEDEMYCQPDYDPLKTLD